MSKNVKKTVKNQQSLRIIGGEFKRRQLDFAAIEGLRPTPDRVRETLFNWLMWDIQNNHVLDVCAGSGALAFEAISRGAQSAVMIEPHRQQQQFLQKNIQLLNLQDKVALYTENAQITLKTLQQKNHLFDLIFLDPPYRLNLWEELANLLLPVCHENSLIYIEADQEISQLKLPLHWQMIKQSKAGQIHFALLKANSSKIVAFS